jgi:hypothetical protein
MELMVQDQQQQELHPATLAMHNNKQDSNNRETGKRRRRT